MHCIIRAAAFFLIIIWNVTGPASATAMEKGASAIVTTGKKPVVSHNVQQAKQGAVTEALTSAVQQVLSQMMTPRLLASNLDYIYNEILTHPTDFILTYKSLGEMESKNTFLVAVESKVNIELLEKTLSDAKILETGKDKPVLMFFISEKTYSDETPRYWWGKTPTSQTPLSEKILTEKMIQNRFVLVGLGPQYPQPSVHNISFVSMDDTQAALRLARELKADMMVFGTAASSLATNRMGEEKTFDGRMLFDIYEVSTGDKIITSKIEAVAKNHSDEEGHAQALIKAAALSADTLTDKINAYWSRSLAKEQSFDLKLTGERFLPRFLALKQRLGEIPEITSMIQKEMGSNSALVRIVYKGKPSRFVNAVMLKTFDSFGLEITGVTDALVTIRFIEKEKASETSQ